MGEDGVEQRYTSFQRYVTKPSHPTATRISTCFDISILPTIPIKHTEIDTEIENYMLGTTSRAMPRATTIAKVLEDRVKGWGWW